MEDPVLPFTVTMPIWSPCLPLHNKVYLGREERYSFTPGQPGSYDNRDGSLCFVSDMPEMYYFLYGEGWSHSQEEMLDRGLTMDLYMEFARLQEGVLRQFTPRREILFAGQPFQAPENYLRNADRSWRAKRATTT